ncbi:MAG: DUF2147 domain-containing protein [Myxococcota bacterium]
MRSLALTMQRLSFGIMTAALVTAWGARAFAAEQSPVGLWKTIDDETGKEKSIVRIWEEDGKMYGKVIKLFRGPDEEQNPKCDKCPGDKKDQPTIGLTILWDLEKDDEEWSGGKILDPNNGKTYKCYIAVEDGGIKLKVRGFIGFALIGRTQYWHRVDESALQ